MTMQGTIVNTLAIIVGSIAGVFLKKGISERHSQSIMHAVGLAVILIGIRGALKSDDLLVVILSLVLGTFLGETIGIEAALEKMGSVLENRYAGSSTGFTKGFVTASLIYCVGAMAIVGSLESGLAGNHQTLYAKSVLDGITSIILASTLGIGVLFSAVSVLVYQGLITVCAGFAKPYLVNDVVLQMSSIGGLLIIAIGLNLLEIKSMRVGNMLPAIFLPLLFSAATRF